MFAEAIEDILRDQCTPAVVRSIECGGSPSSLWSAFSEAGFLDLLKPEAEGGAELPLTELYPIVAQFGRYAVPLPMAQALAARGLVDDSVVLPGGMLTLAPAVMRAGNSGGLRCPLVPFGTLAAHVLAAEGDSRD